MVPSSSQDNPAFALGDWSLKLIQQRPLLTWAAALSLSLVMGGAAMNALISPGPQLPEFKPQPPVAESPKPGVALVNPAPAASQSSPSSATKPSPSAKPGAQSGPQAPESESGIPLWVFGAIALGCAGGSLIVSRLLVSSPSATRRRGPARKTKPVLKAQGARPSKRKVRTAQAPGPKGRRRVPVRSPASQTMAPAPQPMVTVLAPEESHPLDWGETSLAEAMDIRKRRPISSIL